MSKQTRTILQGMLVLILFLFSACSMYEPWETSVSNEDTPDDGSTFETPVGGNISAIEITDTNFEIDLNQLGVEPGNDVVLAVYSYSGDSDAASFQIGSAPKGEDIDWVSDEVVFEDPDAQGFLDKNLRQIEKELSLKKPLAAMRKSSATSMKAGDSRTFKVLSSMSSGNNYQTVTATLRYQSEYFEFWVDNRNANKISDDDLRKLGEDFESVVPLEYEVFGRPSDVDGERPPVVLFSQGVNELGASQGGVVTGFFYAVDLFEASKYPSSNEMEIFYTFVPDDDGDYGSPISHSFAMSNVYSGVLPHELQHMINFNQRYFVNGHVTEAAWLNEALSHFAEDLSTAAVDGRVMGYGLENPSRVSSYLSNISNICFTCGASLSQRGGGYLFIKYLVEQANLGNLPGSNQGFDLIAKLLESEFAGVENVVEAALGEGVDRGEFKDLMGLFGLAVYLSDTGTSDDSRFNFYGINLRGEMDDNRGTYLNGPAIQVIQSTPFVDSITGNSVSYVQIPSAIIEENEGLFQFMVSNGSDFGAYLVK